MFRKILVPIDLNHKSSWERALPIAADQAKHYGAKLTLLNILENVRPIDPLRHVEEKRTKKLQELAEEYIARGVEFDVRVEHYDSVHRCIRRIAADEGIDLIVMNSHHPELRDYILGSNASQVVHHADCSVLVVRSQPAHTP